jgi:hypothetical protein
VLLGLVAVCVLVGQVFGQDYVSVRVVAGSVGAEVELRSGNSTFVHTGALSFSTYARVAWADCCQVQVGGKDVPLARPSNVSKSFASVFVSGTPQGAQATWAWDLDPQGSERLEGIDMARVRVLNTAQVAISVSGVTADCHQCLRPPLIARLAPGAMSEYLDLHVDHPFVLSTAEAAAGDSHVASAALPSWWARALVGPVHLVPVRSERYFAESRGQRAKAAFERPKPPLDLGP